MKTLTRCLLALSLGLAGFGSSLTVLADDTPPPPPPPNEGKPEHGPRHMNAEQQLKMMTERLGLTADQQASILPVLQARDEKAKSFRDLDRDAHREQMKALMTETHDKVGALLTADQKAKWAEMPGPGERHHEKKGDTPPPPPPSAAEEK